MNAPDTALSRLHRRRIDVPLALGLAALALGIGLTTPLLNVSKAFFVDTDYSVWSGVRGLWRDGEYFLALVVLFFSSVFPIGKLALVARIWFFRTAPEFRARWLHRLEELGRWSMLDVFAVAILIVATKLEPLATVEALPGVYWFAAAVLVSMVYTHVVRVLAQRSLTRAPEPSVGEALK